MSLTFFHFLCSLRDPSIQTNRLSAAQRQVRQLQRDVRSDPFQKVTLSLPSTFCLQPPSAVSVSHKQLRPHYRHLYILYIILKLGFVTTVHKLRYLKMKFIISLLLYSFWDSSNEGHWGQENRFQLEKLESLFEPYLHPIFQELKFTLTGSLLDIHFWILWYYLPFVNFNTLLGLVCLGA